MPQAFCKSHEKKKNACDLFLILYLLQKRSLSKKLLRENLFLKRVVIQKHLLNT